jgi:hypothetical protein
VCCSNVRTCVRWCRGSCKWCSDCASKELRRLLGSSTPCKCCFCGSGPLPLDDLKLARLGLSFDARLRLQARIEDVPGRTWYCGFGSCNARHLAETDPRSKSELCCLACTRVTCGKCTLPVHPGLGCTKPPTEAERDLALQLGSRPCPRCSTLVCKRRDDGCHQVNCPGCLSSFCICCGMLDDDCDCPSECGPSCVACVTIGREHKLRAPVLSGVSGRTRSNMRSAEAGSSGSSSAGAGSSGSSSRSAGPSIGVKRTRAAAAAEAAGRT